jgi:predicted component of type VI protein secretion system
LLTDLENGTGTFAKIDNKLKLKSGVIVSFGDTHMLITIGESENLELKFIDGPKFDTVMHYTPADNEISIGRMPDCTIRFEDNSLSRYQCTVSYERGWCVTDGYRGKNSTNGTWIFTDTPFAIHDHMTFKSGNKLFEVEFF